MSEHRVVLIVDDEDFVRSMLGILIKGTGGNYNIIGKDNAEDGFNEIRSKKPDLLITDIGMPVMDGLDFIKRLRNVPEDIPIIIISGREENRDNAHKMNFSNIVAILDKSGIEKTLPDALKTIWC